MSDRRKEAEEKMEKAIFISADCWLCVFDLLPTSQLGFGISMISHRFDFYVDEHFKTRKWTLKFIEIRSKIGKNGTKEMDIVNCYGIPIPIPQIQMPLKVIGFERININFIDQNVIAFLHRFRQLFAVCPINLAIETTNDRISKFILHNIWPLLGKNILVLELSVGIFPRLRQIAPSILNDCPSLRFVFFDFGDLFTEFPADDSAAASDGQALAKWLFTPLQNNVPKMFNCWLRWDDGNLASRIEDFKAAFTNASSPANFIAIISCPLPFADSVVPFALTNELTREQLALKVIDNSHRFLFVRCPISRDESKWTKWEKEAIGWRISYLWNRIDIEINKDDIGDGKSRRKANDSDELTGDEAFDYIHCLSCCFLLIRCPIARDESKWAKWEKKALGWEIYDQWNKIGIQINNEDQIGDGLLDATPGPSDQKKNDFVEK